MADPNDEARSLVSGLDVGVGDDPGDSLRLTQPPDEKRKIPYDDRTPSFRRGDPDTSIAAARSIDPERLTGSQRIILSTFRLARRALTDEELIAEVGRHFPMRYHSPSGIRTRRRELERVGILVEAGEGRTVAGRPCRKFALAGGVA